MPRRLFVTTALPYANGKFHVGHIMEYIQADIWVRFQRMQGHEVHFMGADDAHGAPIMLAAEKAGKTPEQAAAEWKLPEKYKGYSGTVSPMMGGMAGRLQLLATEMKK